jgi:hypothetical protein
MLALVRINPTNAHNAHDLSPAIDNLIINLLAFLMLFDWQPLLTGLALNYTNVRRFACNPLR